MGGHLRATLLNTPGLSLQPLAQKSRHSDGQSERISPTGGRCSEAPALGGGQRGRQTEGPLGKGSRASPTCGASVWGPGAASFLELSAVSPGLSLSPRASSPHLPPTPPLQGPGATDQHCLLSCWYNTPPGRGGSGFPRSADRWHLPITAGPSRLPGPASVLCPSPSPRPRLARRPSRRLRAPVERGHWLAGLPDRAEPRSCTFLPSTRLPTAPLPVLRLKQLQEAGRGRGRGDSCRGDLSRGPPMDAVGEGRREGRWSKLTAHESR